MPNGGVGYAEPIWMGAQCLVCHGKAIAPNVEARLDAAYPQDAARGFELGALRGFFWAEVHSAR